MSKTPNKIDPAAMRTAISDMRANREMVETFMFEIAFLLRAKYSGLLKEGFSKEQAIELCKGSLYHS